MNDLLRVFQPRNIGDVGLASSAQSALGIVVNVGTVKEHSYLRAGGGVALKEQHAAAIVRLCQSNSQGDIGWSKSDSNYLIRLLAHIAPEFRKGQRQNSGKAGP